MEPLQRVVEVLEKGTLSGCLEESEVQKGLNNVSVLLAAAAGEDSFSGGKENEGSRGRLQWSRQQLELILTVADAVICACFDFPADGGDKYVLGKIFQHTIQLCVQNLEKFVKQSTSKNEFIITVEQVEHKSLQLLETILDDKRARARRHSSLWAWRDLASKLSCLDTPLTETIEYSLHHPSKCTEKVEMEVVTSNKLKESRHSEDILVLLASEKLLARELSCGGSETQAAEALLKPSSSIIAATQYHAVVQLGLVKRLLSLVVFTLNQFSGLQEDMRLIQESLAFVCKILKLVMNLVRGMTVPLFEEDALCDLVSVAASLPHLLGRTGYSSNLDMESVSDNSQGSFSEMVDNLLDLTELMFPNQAVYHNTRTYVTASILDALPAGGRHEISSGLQQLPLACTPQVVNCLMNLLQATCARPSGRFQHEPWKSVDLTSRTFPVYDSTLSSSELYLCHLRSEDFILNDARSYSDHLQIIFPGDGRWLDQLITVALIFHSHWSKSRLSADSASSIQSEDESMNVSADSVTVGSEDDALFGDLFSESGRHSVTSEDTGQAYTTKKMEAVRSSPLQVTCHILTFLKDFIFLEEWNKIVFETATKCLSKEHVNALLQIHLSQLSLLEKHPLAYDATEQEGIDLVVLLQKTSFDLLYALVVRGTLSHALECHFFGQILKGGELGFASSPRLVMILSKLLIGRSKQRASWGNDPLVFELWKNFLDSIVMKARHSKSPDTTVDRVSRILPSWFHMEVLFMAFHSVDSMGRANILENLLSALETCLKFEKQLSGTSLAVWSLLLSRLLFAVKYVVIHFSSFPKWLLLDLAKKSRLDEGANFCWSIEEKPFLSWASHLSRIIFCSLQSTGQASLDEQWSQQLFDVSEFSGYIGDQGIRILENSCGDLYKLRRLLYDVVMIWSGICVKNLDELILERHIFLLCWSILVRPDLPWQIVPPWESGLADKAEVNAGEFLDFSVGVYALSNKDNDQNIDKMVAYILHTVENLDTIVWGKEADHSSWKFFGHGAFLELLLSLLCEGFKCIEGPCDAYNVENPASVVKPFNSILVFVVRHLLKTGTVVCLTRGLCSILSFYVETFKNCVAEILSQQFLSKDAVISANLLLRSCVNKDRQQNLLEKIGVNLSSLRTMQRQSSPPSWKAESIALLANSSHGGQFGDLDTIMFTAMLHGFPSSSHVGSAALSSCLLSMEAILETLDSCVKALVSSVTLKGLLEPQTFEKLFVTVMNMSFDSSFETVHSKCTSILHSLILTKKKQILYRDLFFLKHIEDLLCALCIHKEVNEAVQEAIVIQAVDSIEAIYRDAERSEAIKLYFLFNVKHKSSTEGEFDQMTNEWHEFQSLVGSGNLSVLVDVLDGCCSEAVKVKSLQLLCDLLHHENSSLLAVKQKLEEKLLAMDRTKLAAWLKHILLGYSTENGGVVVQQPTPFTVRDLGIEFIRELGILPATSQPSDFSSYLFEAMILNLDQAFLIFDMTSAKLYFSLMVQLAFEKSIVERILISVLNLFQKMPSTGAYLEGFKYLLGFLRSVFAACGAQKMQIDGKSADLRLEEGTAGLQSSLQGAKAACAMGRLSERFLETEPTNESGVTPAECDGNSVDEDEDDAASDAELASMDREEDDDGSFTEKALASKICTFTSSGSNFMEQHWYFCYTCDLTVSKGCCSVCARVCHRGHKVVYSRHSRFFCDCGAGGVRGTNCLCLKPRKYISCPRSAPPTSTSTSNSFLPISAHQNPIQQSDSESEIDNEDIFVIDEPCKIPLHEGEEKILLHALQELNVEGHLLSLCQRLMSDLNLGLNSGSLVEEITILGADKHLIAKNDLSQLKRAYKSGFLDMKIKADYSNARELKSHLLAGVLVKSLLSINNRGRLAAGEGDKVVIFDVGQLIGQSTAAPVTIDKSTMKPLSKNAVRFELVHLVFNSANESYLALAGYEDCQVFTVNSRGEVTDRIAIELALEDAYVRSISWVPGSQVQLMVVTNRFVKIFDLSQDKICPLHYLTILEDCICDAALVPIGQGEFLILVLSQSGILYVHRINKTTDSGACIMTDTVQLPLEYRPSKGISMHYSPSYKLLFLSYNDGMSLIARLNGDATALEKASAIFEVEQDGKSKPAGVHHWKDSFDSSGLYLCLSSNKSNSAMTIQLEPMDLPYQQLRISGNAASLRVDGLATYQSATKGLNNILILYDDGSLHVYSHDSASLEYSGAQSIPHKQSSALEAEQVKKLGAVLLGSKPANGAAPVFPLDFFEKTSCITAEIKWGGDILRNFDSDGVKTNLASEDGFIEGPNATGFKIVACNPNPDQVMVGCRVHVGNTTASHIPSELRVFQRSIRLEEGVRCWYDIPFTNSEALLADEEFTLTVGPTFNASSLPRIDCLEVYGRFKEEFGWKEKLDAVLDMENQSQVISKLLPGFPGSGVKHKKLQSASVLEQVVFDSFRIICDYYFAFRVQLSSETENHNALELSRKKCVPILEEIFEGDRQPLLQSAARRILRALYPNKDSYYKAKDSMRLAGVARSCLVIGAKLTVGGAGPTRVIQHFMSQLQSVCKVAWHRPRNLADYLENINPSFVEDLMDILCEILRNTQPDPLTINNLVIPTVDVMYVYAECLAVHFGITGISDLSVVPAVNLLRKLLFSPHEAVRSSCSLAISSRLLQVPFPKQTMLAMDDLESARAPLVPQGVNDTSSGQLMVDEATASVQYCCDGCNTVPILRRRWHCNVCPDFDLCEACYEVMDADQLPPPHSREHPMSAITIEADLGGSEGDSQFPSIDKVNDESAVQIETDLGLPVGDSLEIITEARDFSMIIANENISSATSSVRNAVNALLLNRLVQDIKGWAKVTSGAEAIPLMQLFYRLAFAPSGPLMGDPSSEKLDLEKLIQSMLDELDLSTLLSLRSRSNFGEVVILFFMFFTLVLKNWHQAGSEQSQTASSETSTTQGLTGSESPSNETSAITEQCPHFYRACSLLRQQSLLSYLFQIIQQLSHVFKSPSRVQDLHGIGSINGSCGALLTVRKEFAAGSFAPFFSDSSAKSHRGDLFADFHRLLLESAFRLTYCIIRPGKLEKTVEKDQSTLKVGAGIDLKLDGWQEVLCGYINNPHTTFIKKYARKLLLYLCGTKQHYYNMRDAWLLNRELKRFFKLAQKSGGFQVPISYERGVKLLKCLCAIVDVARARPRNWQKYCSRHVDVIQLLLNNSFCFAEELVVQILKLLNLIFYTGKESSGSVKKEPEVSAATNSSSTSTSRSLQPEGRKDKRGGGDDGIGNVSNEKAFVEMEQAVELLAAEDGQLLKSFVDKFLLQWNAASVRAEAKSILQGAWHHGRRTFRVLLVTSLLEKICTLPSYGQNIVEFSDLLSWLLRKASREANANGQEVLLVQGCLDEAVLSTISQTLCIQNELLANHPNSRIYNTLATLVEFDGYYLESEPCLACSTPEVPYTRMKLDSIKSETKFTDNRILVKCVGSHTIQSVSMTVHDARRSKSVKVINLYYNNRVVPDLSELKNNRTLWKRAKSCHLASNQTELKVEFPIPITACNFMIELDSFYENLQAASMESLQCPRCSRYVTDKHGICSHCHENAYQCRQCRNINYENLDSFLCNECGYSKYGRFEFSFMAKPSFSFDSMENDEDMKRGLAAIEAESENAHRRYQQLLGYKKPLLKLVSSIGETEMDSQQRDSVQQMIVSLPGSSSFKINRKIAILGVLYGEKCKMAFDSVSKSVQTLQGLRSVLMSYLERKQLGKGTPLPTGSVAKRPENHCFGCANTFVGHCLEWLQILAKYAQCRQQLVAAGILRELFENNIHQGPKSVRVQARGVICTLTEGDATAMGQLNSFIKEKVLYCLDHHRSMDIALCVRDELQLLSETCSLADEFWESRLRIVFQLLFRSIQVGAQHPVLAEYIILPCLKIVAQACTPPNSEANSADSTTVPAVLRSETRTEEGLRSTITINSTLSPSKSQFSLAEGDGDQELAGQDVLLVNYIEWRNGVTYVDFVRRQYAVTQPVKTTVQKIRNDSRRTELALKYILKWKRQACKVSLTEELSAFEESTWVRELVLSPCSQMIRVEICGLIEVLCAQSQIRRTKFLDLLMALLPATRHVGESAAEYFELLFKMIEPEEARLYLTVRGFLNTACSLIYEEVGHIEAQEHSFHTDISQGYILQKLIELLSKFLQVPNIRKRFMKEELLAQVLEALLVIRGLIVQKTKLISDCGRLLRNLLDDLQENYENKRHFVRACVSRLEAHCQDKKDRTLLFILEQLCNIICPTKPEPSYLLVLNKVQTQEEFIRGSMTKNPYSSLEIGPLMRDVKNKICQQLELIGLLEDDYGMELLVSGNIISLDLTIGQVYEKVWKKAQSQVVGSAISSSLLSSGSGKECPPMIITYRLQGLDGEATEPMIKELEDDREECLDPEVEFAIAGVMQECGGLRIVLKLVQQLSDEEIKSGQEEVVLLLNLLMLSCKIRGNRQALLGAGALYILLETARRAFFTDAAGPAESLLLIVECLVTEANESELGADGPTGGTGMWGGGELAANAVLMFLERLSRPDSQKMNKQQHDRDAVARILTYLTFGDQTAMDALVSHFSPYLKDWSGFDRMQKQQADSTKVEAAQQAAEHQLALDNFIRVIESIKMNANGEGLKHLIMERGIVNGAVRHLKAYFPAVERGTDYKSFPEWTLGLEMPSVPIILSILRGLCRGHRPTQQCLDEEGILPLLHALEGVSGESEIGARAENLLDTLADKNGFGEGFLADKVLYLRHVTRDEMRRRALQRREELLQGLGMRREFRSDGGERIVVARPSIEGLEEVEEEEAGLACIVCREGYKLRPTEMLGTYSYSKRVNLTLGTPSHARVEWVYTTVSHFNVIHFQCHQEAKRADTSLKTPKKEWEGAALRNNETLCNNIFPLRGPAVPLAQYARCVDHYWDGLSYLGRADGSRLRLLVYDIVLMLGRFATGASFSTDSKGGGKESNSRILPFMIQMACHLLDQQGASQRRIQAKALKAYLSSSSMSEHSEPGPLPSTPTPPLRGGSSDETVQFMMVQSLLLQSLSDWQHDRCTFLRRSIYHAYMLYKQGRPSFPTSPSHSPAPPRVSLSFSPPLPGADTDQSGEYKEDIKSDMLSKEQLFCVVHPMLVYVGLIDQLQLYLKKTGCPKTRDMGLEREHKSGDDGNKDEAATGYCGIEPWEVSMKNRLRDVASLLAFSKELLEWLEQIQAAEDVQEALDIMDALGDALSGGFSSCEDFVRDALTSGQND